MATLVRNAMNTVTVFSVPEKKIAIEWQPSGDPEGNDLQQIPDEILDNMNFIRAVNRGVLEVLETSPELEAQLRQQSEFWRQRRERGQAQINASIRRETDNDMVTVACVGPDARGTERGCAEMVPVRSVKRDEQPPLCSRHQHLAPQFVMTHTDEDDPQTGKAVVRWERMGVGARERQVY